MSVKHRRLPRGIRGVIPVLGTAGIVTALALLGSGYGHAEGAATSGTNIVLQTMDSCKQAVGGAQFQLLGGDVDLQPTTPSGGPRTVSVAEGCPLEQGDCLTSTVGCVTFEDVPAGTYRIHELSTPEGGNNGDGYAACTGGSACQSEIATVTVSSDGTVSATVVNVYPDGTTFTSPSFAGTVTDPIVFHSFALGSGICDAADVGVFDAENHLTGTPSSHCRYEVALRGTACTPYPWSCTLTPWTAEAPTPGATPTPSATTTPAPSTSQSPNQKFVSAMFLDMLGRSADAGGLNYWSAALDSGVSRATVGAGLIDSDEYRAEVINADYNRMFERGADPGGLAFWTGYMRNGGTDEQVLANLISSPEYFADAGDNNGQFVSNVYRDLLDRAGDPDGLAYWTAQLKAGTPRPTVVVRLLYGTEYRSDVLTGTNGNKRIVGLYPRYLHRPADAGGVTYWVGQMTAGASDEDIVLNFVASPEYFNTAQGYELLSEQ